MRRLTSVLLALLCLVANVVGQQAAASAAGVPEIWFPVQVQDGVAWADTFGDPRGGGRTHKGVDIMAPQGMPVYAAVSGWIHRAYGGDDRSCLDGGYCTSYGLLQYGDDGRSYFYLHLNDDTPGRPNGCDHLGGAEHAYAPRLVQILRERGTLEPLPARWDPRDVVRVEQGELLGWVGSSGNAGCKIDHLHFETWDGHDFLGANDSSKDNPYPIVQAAVEAGRFWGPYGPIRPDAMERLAGPDRVATAIAISQDAFESAPTVVVAPAEVYAEALLGAPLAAALDGPVLLHWGTAPVEGQPAVAPALVDEIARLGATDVVVLSVGEDMHPGFDAALAEATGIDPDRVRRLQTDDRYDLSALIAREMLVEHGWPADDEPGQPEQAEGDGDEVSLLLEVLGAQGTEPEPEDPPAPLSPILALGEHEVEGRGWPDALAAATLAAAQRVPILLTRPDELPQATAEMLQRDGFSEVRIVGGPGAISDEVEAQVNATGHETRRLAGSNRFETALAIADELIQLGDDVSDVHIATGDNFPDAMAAGASVAHQNRILLLVDGEVAEGAPAVLQWLREHADEIDEVTAIGGPRVVADHVLRVAAIHANWPVEEPADEQAA